MVDARKIRSPKYTRLLPFHVDLEYSNSCRFISDARKAISGPKVLITHHALCTLSNDPYYEGDVMNEFFVNNNDQLLEGYDYHIHGHVHCNRDYEIHGCNVLCNPKGYGNENSNFKLRYFEI